MNILGFEITLRRRIQSANAKDANLQAVSSFSWLNSWKGVIRESFAGAWQRNVTIDTQPSLLAFSAVFACVTGIASDIAKMRIKLSRNVDGIWKEITADSPFLKVLRKPNHYQTRIQFIALWIVSKLLFGNAYILKQRQDRRGMVTALYVLDPSRVTVLVADNGDVYYELDKDPLSQLLDESKVVPASEIIHDTMICLWHPLIGVSPIYACGMSATMGNKIQTNSTTLFGNLSRPGGMLSAPGHIADDTAARLKAYWETNFSGENLGRLAVAGDGLKFEVFSMPAIEAQLIEQLGWTVEDVGRAFHYPQYKLGGPLPPYASNLEALNMGYFSDCLQTLIESIELSLDEGLDLPPGLGTEMDLDNLMRMDTAALYDSNSKGAGWLKINEMRFRANYPPVAGGDSPMLQQQNYSLEALAKRDAQEDPFKSATPVPLPQLPPVPDKPAVPPVKEMDVADLEFFETETEKELCLR